MSGTPSMQDYKSSHVAAMIRTALGGVRTHTYNRQALIGY